MRSRPSPRLPRRRNPSLPRRPLPRQPRRPHRPWPCPATPTSWTHSSRCPRTSSRTRWRTSSRKCWSLPRRARGRRSGSRFPSRRARS
ncbi:MAG: hypothetical protein DMF79_11115 [Acidobacteria bacterium]|nr:MAG: hypothetical protein DMF79_11115 [Acidobacteriota bacterium]